MECSKSLRVSIFLFCCMAFFTNLYAQKVYRNVRNKTYVIDNDLKKIYNKSNLSDTASQYEPYDPEKFEVQNWQIVKEAIKESLSGERLKDLWKDSFGMVINCDYDGNIKSMRFIFHKNIFLTVEEIEKIETNLKKKKFSIVPYEIGKKNGIQLAIPCRMSTIS